MYLTLHSYGQMFLFPWGYDRIDHTREYELERMGRLGARAMGRGYTVGSAAKVLYPAAGGSDDWAFGGAKIPYSYTIGNSNYYHCFLLRTIVRTSGHRVIRVHTPRLADKEGGRGDPQRRGGHGQ